MVIFGIILGTLVFLGLMLILALFLKILFNKKSLQNKPLENMPAPVMLKSNDEKGLIFYSKIDNVYTVTSEELTVSLLMLDNDREALIVEGIENGNVFIKVAAKDGKSFHTLSLDITYKEIHELFHNFGSATWHIPLLPQYAALLQQTAPLEENLLKENPFEMDYDALKLVLNNFGLSWILQIGTPIGEVADDEDIELKKAVIKGKSDRVKLLLDRKADPNTRKDMDGFFKGWHVPLRPSTTPLMYAVEHHHFNIVQSLIEAKADPGLKTHGFFGKTALDLAKEKGHQEIQTYLENL